MIEIAATILSVGTLLISTGLSYVVSLNQKKVDFNYKHQNYLLDKRKSVYDEIEKTMDKLLTVTHELSGARYHDIFLGYGPVFNKSMKK